MDLVDPNAEQSASPPRRSIRRWGLRAFVAGLAILVPAVTLAIVSPFSDVDPSNPFFNNIVAMSKSGISTGCGGGKFCPTDNVTREQMSAFLNRAAPRETATAFAFPLGIFTPAANSVVATVTATSLNNEYLSISAAFYAVVSATAATYPCEKLYDFFVDGVKYGLPVMYNRTLAQPSAYVIDNLAGQVQVAVGPGTHTVQLRYSGGSGTCNNYPGNGALSVQVIPFSGDMSSISSLAPAAVSGKAPSSADQP